jgi:hypothetical protein
MPDGENISVVMVERDSAQRLWKFPLKGGVPACIMNKVDSIGYHCWINKDSVALFVLTKPAFTLQIADIRSQETYTVADSIGRCMRMKGGALWYTTKAGNLSNVYEYYCRAKKNYIKGGIEGEDYCFVGKYEIWFCSKSSIFSGYVNSKLGPLEIADLGSFGIHNITRISISNDQTKVAVVSNK